ncbi:hypothetical protein Q0Z83_078790 [Actinoplanes sichuanensis]|uniref:Uncharacterized protein n=1 Tax=Actinoplanes sichuanensis TaxID=512349 RepID=A0ABW4AFH7_9ACTN|nr:hypothetical protein [Actinoplanes sichuanensis]BEL09688.1 hypothetical protein Q0Z83_078790 [Actinoplanes sichuanensis]
MLDGRNLGFGGFIGRDPGEGGRLIDEWRDPGEVGDVGDRVGPDRPDPAHRRLDEAVSDLSDAREG